MLVAAPNRASSTCSREGRVASEIAGREEPLEAWAVVGASEVWGL